MTNLISNIFIPIRPVPASRPRVGKYGAYYTENYTNFRKEMKDFIVKNNIKRFTRSEDLFKVEMEFICKRPNRPQNEYPRGDVDNFAKGPLDVLTHCECFWYDDVQITELNVVKRYAIGDEQYGIRIIISTI